MNPTQTLTLDLNGLHPAPAQVWGKVRLLPLIRTNPHEDLRLHKVARRDPEAPVLIKGRPDGSRIIYQSFIPSGLILRWNKQGQPVAAPHTRLCEDKDEPEGRWYSHHLVRRLSEDRLRWLPQHLCMDALLALHFGGPDLAWPEYSRRTLSHGLSPREEHSVWGDRLADLADALRVFEIHEGQCGVVVFVGGTLASIFVVPHPDDYRGMHAGLIEDFYGEDLVWAGRYGLTEPEEACALATDGVRSVEDLRAALAQARAQWSSLGLDSASGLLGRSVQVQTVYTLPRWSLGRFATGFGAGEENHLGELLRRDDGTVEYLRSYRMSAAQLRRGQLLQTLAAHRWHPQSAAAALNTDLEGLHRLLTAADLGGLLDPTLWRNG